MISVCSTGRTSLKRLLFFRKNLDRLDQYLKADNSDALKNEFRKARALRNIWIG